MKVINFYVNNLTFLLIACLPLIAYLSSCQSPHFYRPKPHEPVLLTHSSQLKLNAVSDDNMDAFSIAYSPINRLGLTAGAGSFKEGDKIGERYFNPYLSVGYYKKLPFNTLIESYGGLGIYNYKNMDEATVKKIRYYNYFVQPSLAFIHKKLEVALTLRLDYLKRFKTEISNDYYPGDYSLDFLKYDNYFFVQPGCTVRFGFNHFKFQIQATKSNPFNYGYGSIYGTVYNSDINADVFDNSWKWGSGITVDFDVLKKRYKLR